MYDETISGDISNSPSSPLEFALSEGSNSLSATTGNGDQEYVTVTVPEGFELASLTLESYEGSDRVAFISVQEGTTFTEPLDESATQSNLLGYTLFGSAGQVGSDILDNISNGAGAAGFDGPLPAGTYTFALQQLGDPSTYTLDFNLAEATTEPTEPPTEPPTGEPPVVSFETVPATYSEEDANNLVEWKWIVTGDFPEEGITINLDTSGGGDTPFAFTEQFATEPEAEFINSDIVGFDNDTGRLNILLSEPEASFKLYFINDILEEGTQEFDFQLAEGDDYTVDPDTNGGIFTITDDNGGPGVGPTIGLTTSETELTEGDTFTVTLTAEGEIPADGVQVLVQSDVPGSLGQFDLADLGNITTTGIEGLPTVGDGGGGSFFVTMTEPTATITLGVFDDILAEEPLPITFTVANGEEYEVDAANPSITLNITDQEQPAGPTVSLTVDKTEVTEGETITLSFAVDGEIPEGGLQVLVNDTNSAQNQLRSLTEFEVGSIETTGIAGLPEGADGDSGFFVTLTEANATLTVPVFDEGADEDEATEVFTFELIDGEAYEVDADASSFTLNISDPVDGGNPPTGDLPVVRFTAEPTSLSEAEGTPLVLKFDVVGEFPEDGVVVRFNEDFFDNNDQIDFNIFETEGLEFFDFEETSPGRFTVDYKLTQPNATLTTAVFDDNIAEPDGSYAPALLPIPDANYTLDPEASSIDVSITDGVDGTGGPVVSLSVENAEVSEGDSLTLTLTAEGEIPAGGVVVNVDSDAAAALGEFVTVDENGIPQGSFTGIEGLPAPNGDASGFTVTMVENTATITLDEIFDDGLAEGTENFEFSVLDGETYDIDPATNSVNIALSDADNTLPVVGVTASSDVVSEEEEDPSLTFTFTVEGEIPDVVLDTEGNYVSGGLPIRYDGSSVLPIFDEISDAPVYDGVVVTGFPTDPDSTEYEFTLLDNTSTITLSILNDVVQEADEDYAYGIIADGDAPYAVDPDAAGGAVTLTDGQGGPGVGPTVSISVDKTELSEGDTFTVSFAVEGEIPAEGLQVLVDSPTPRSLGEFVIFNEDGSPAVALEGIDGFPEVGDTGASSFLVTLTEPNASLTLSVFEDGPTEGLETLEFSLIDGEVYEVDSEASSITLNINDGGEDAVFEAEAGVTSVFLDFPLLEEVAGLTLVGADSDATPFSDDFQVGFAITDETDFSFAPAPFTPAGGTIEHDGTITVGLGGAEATIGEFSIGFDPSRVSDTASGFFVADTLEDPLGLEILFDIGAPGTLNVGSNELEISSADLLLAPELADALGLADLAGADVGDARVDALLELMGGDMPPVGTDESDTLVGDDADNSLDGLAGDDTLAGGLGNDIILGGDGDDVLRGDLNDPSPQDDSAGGNDIIFGGEGSDRIGGKAGNDILSGDAGDDFIWGDDGDDILMGVTGNDTLVGDNFSDGSGSDLFVFGNGDGTDTIVDFEVGTDRIGLVEGELTFADLTITQDGNNTLLGVTDSNEVLAIVQNVQASALIESSFEIVADVSNPEEALMLI
ncbi:MAG: calcium-binding protein [Cyanobacteria bacterium J06650_10]